MENASLDSIIKHQRIFIDFIWLKNHIPMKEYVISDELDVIIYNSLRDESDPPVPQDAVVCISKKLESKDLMEYLDEYCSERCLRWCLTNDPEKGMLISFSIDIDRIKYLTKKHPEIPNRCPLIGIQYARWEEQFGEMLCEGCNNR